MAEFEPGSIGQIIDVIPVTYTAEDLPDIVKSNEQQTVLVNVEKIAEYDGRNMSFNQGQIKDTEKPNNGVPCITVYDIGNYESVTWAIEMLPLVLTYKDTP